MPERQDEAEPGQTRAGHKADQEQESPVTGGISRGADPRRDFVVDGRSAIAMGLHLHAPDQEPRVSDDGEDRGGASEPKAKSNALAHAADPLMKSSTDSAPSDAWTRRVMVWADGLDR